MNQKIISFRWSMILGLLIILLWVYYFVSFHPHCNPYFYDVGTLNTTITGKEMAYSEFIKIKADDLIETLGYVPSYEEMNVTYEKIRVLNTENGKIIHIYAYKFKYDWQMAIDSDGKIYHISQCL